MGLIKQKTFCTEKETIIKMKKQIKRNETELFVMRWMDLESVIQSEVSQKRKTNTIC